MSKTDCPCFASSKAPIWVEGECPEPHIRLLDARAAPLYPSRTTLLVSQRRTFTKTESPRIHVLSTNISFIRIIQSALFYPTTT